MVIGKGDYCEYSFFVDFERTATAQRYIVQYRSEYSLHRIW